MFFLGGEGAHHGYEGLWRHEPISTLGWSTQTASLPLVVDLPHGPKLGVLEADLDDYPAMYLTSRPSQPRTLSAFFPRRVVKEQPGGYLNFLLTATERADDIAETAGTPHLSLARVRARSARRRPRRQRHGDPARAAARAGQRLLLGEAGQGRLGLLGRLEPRGRRLRGGPQHEDLQVLRRLRREARSSRTSTSTGCGQTRSTSRRSTRRSTSPRSCATRARETSASSSGA